MPPKPVDKQTFEEIKKAALALVARNSERDTMYKRYRDIYFMDNIEKPKGGQIDQNDWKLTPSPSGRNSVVGMQRLLNTSDVHVEIKDSDETRDASEIKEGLKAILRASSRGRRGTIQSDAALSAVLYGVVVLYAESIDDLLKNKTLKPYKRRHLEKKIKETPFLIRTLSADESYAEWDDDMMLMHVWKYRTLGAQLRARWGVDAKDNTEYQVYDVFTNDHHVVWADGHGELFSGEHGLGCVPIFVAYAGGSDLFHKPHEAMQAFLYAKAKAGLDRRENSVLTTVFTNIHMRGLLGPMMAVNPETAPEEIVVSHAGGARWVKADAKQIDERIINPEIFQAKNLLDDLDGQSTIQRSTLGENVGGGVPFSSLAMLSNSGKLPLVDPQRAIEYAFTACFEHILYRIKNDPIENEIIDPTKLTDNMQIEVSLSAKLPQDSLRNATIAQSLGDLVSDEWKQRELLQINDSGDMEKQIVRQNLRKAVFMAVLQNPQIMQQAVASVMGGQGQPQTQQPQQGQPMPQDQMMPQGQPTPEQMAMMQGGPGMESMGMTDSMVPPQESANVQQPK